MAIGRVNAAGGAGLNFRVLAYASELLLPAAAKENDIAVITDTVITSWAFSSTAPVSPAEGMVWFDVAANSPASFNALKKNGIWVYPTGCKQYISGAWVDKIAKTYQNGAWAAWSTMLYSIGNEYTEITGGWTNSGYTGNQTVITKGANSMSVSGSAGNYWGTIGTAISINLSNNDTLKAVCKTNNSLAKCYLCASEIKSPNTGIMTRFTNTDFAEISCDISAVEGYHYIVISTGDSATLTVSEIWLE